HSFMQPSREDVRRWLRFVKKHELLCSENAKYISKYISCGHSDEYGELLLECVEAFPYGNDDKWVNAVRAEIPNPWLPRRRK
ncbi:hypothetical protein LCGC14_0575580, partial [marine sediment metagenome]